MAPSVRVIGENDIGVSLVLTAPGGVEMRRKPSSVDFR